MSQYPFMILTHMQKNKYLEFINGELNSKIFFWLWTPIRCLSYAVLLWRSIVCDCDRQWPPMLQRWNAVTIQTGLHWLFQLHLLVLEAKHGILLPDSSYCDNGSDWWTALCESTSRGNTASSRLIQNCTLTAGEVGEVGVWPQLNLFSICMQQLGDKFRPRLLGLFIFKRFKRLNDQCITLCTIFR